MTNCLIDKLIHYENIFLSIYFCGLVSKYNLPYNLALLKLFIHFSLFKLFDFFFNLVLLLYFNKLE